jgi:hypothetical protein
MHKYVQILVSITIYFEEADVMLGVVTHACNPSAQVAEAGGS